MRDSVAVLALLLMPLLVSCGNDSGEEGLLTGASGVLIFGIVAWVIYRTVRNRT